MLSVAVNVCEPTFSNVMVPASAVPEPSLIVTSPGNAGKVRSAFAVGSELVK